MPDQAKRPQLLTPSDVTVTIFANDPVLCQIVQLLGHLKTAMDASFEQKKQIDLTVHVNNNSGTEMNLMVGRDIVPAVHGSTHHYIGDGVGF